MASEALQGSTNALKDLTGPDLNVQKPVLPPDAEEGPSVKAPQAAAHDAHRRSGRTRTVRVRDGFFDSSLLHYVSMDASAAGAVPDDALANSRRSPKPSNPKSSAAVKSSAAAEFEYDDDTPLGPDHQASIPAWRPRPAQPTAAEAKFLPAAPLYAPADPAVVAATAAMSSKTRAGRAGVTVPMPPVGVAASSADFRYKIRWAKDAAGRRKLISAAISALDKQLGPNMVKVLGLDGLGFKCAQSWQPHEELLFCLGMCDKYRMFKYIRQCYLWSRSAHELNGYYHNVWKTRSTPEADEFLTLREEEATREEFSAFFDKVRDRLIAMWDKKKMGDMPKLVKDMAAAAAAATSAAAGAAKERNKQAELFSSSEDEGDASDSSTSTADDSDSSHRAARSKQQKQKKRPAAVMSGGSGSKAAAKKVKPNHSSAQLQGVQGAPQQRRRLDVGWQQQQQSRQHHNGLPTPTGAPVLQQWLHPGQLQRQQRPRSATRPGSGVSPAHTPLQLPDMPQLPRPDLRDAAAIAAWIKALPEFKEAMGSYLDTVQSVTDGAIKDCESYIMQLQGQRSRIKAEADAYIKALLAQGQEAVASMSADKQQQAPPPPQQQQQQAAVVKQEAVTSAAQAAEQQQASGPQPDQQQQQERAAHAGSDREVDAKTTSRQPAHAGSSDLDKQQPAAQEQEQQHDKQQQDQGAVMDAAPAAQGPAPDSTEPSQQPPQQQQDVARHSQLQQQDQQQTEQPAAAGPVDVTSPLPFPGGPLNKWLAPRLQQGGSSSDSGLKHIPRPYIKRQKLEGGGTPGHE